MARQLSPVERLTVNQKVPGAKPGRAALIITAYLFSMRGAKAPYALLDNRLSRVPFKHEGPDHPRDRVPFNHIKPELTGYDWPVEVRRQTDADLLKHWFVSRERRQRGEATMPKK